MSRTSEIKLFRSTYKNWVSVARDYHSRKPKIESHFRSGVKEALNLEEVFLINRYIETGKDARDALKLVKNCEVPFEGRILKIGGDLNGFTIFETFIREDYKGINVKDKLVLDIGANIGDTAIYFAIHGAKKVISLEPFPNLFRIAKENVIGNGFEDTVQLLNAGYGKGSEIVIEESLKGEAGSQLKASRTGSIIKLFTLKELIKEFGITDAVLKIDCEGCEYDLLSEENESLKRFSDVQIEYHYGFKVLVEKLKDSGFQVNFTDPFEIFNKAAINSKMEVGFIYAKRK